MFSILTPTYNRADTLHRVYESLIAQTEKDFEWIIVDDGSNDNTFQLVDQWKTDDASITIHYHKLQTNMGKSTAVNAGLKLCSREITIIADSDDSFKATTLSDLRLIWNSINRTQNKDRVAAVWTLVENEDGQLIGEQFPSNFWQVDFKQRVLNRKSPIQGEKWHSWRTGVLQEYQISSSPNSHVSPSVSWNRINKDYEFLCVNVVHRVYWYTSDGIIHENKSKLKIEAKNYYNSYFQLKNTSGTDILKYRYYRNLSFSYIKSLFHYRDKNNCLKGGKLALAFLVFIWITPSRILHKFSVSLKNSGKQG